MDILAIIFLIFGWIYKIKGLVIAAIILSSIIVLFTIYKVAEKNKGQISLIFDFILLAFSIVGICIL
jgi:4-hydroxybenzoate polyprenyltransferase